MATKGLPSIGPRSLRIVALAVVGMLVVAAVIALRPGPDQKLLTASFPRTVSVYEGSDVRVLGVGIGTVETVEPAGTTVKVTMRYDADVKVPADVKAAVIAPSVVGDRFVQLTPAYTKGPVLEDGATLDTDRTAVPLELDQIYQSIDDLAVGLGPEGANRDGALSRLLDSTARNFGGQGEQFNETIRNLSRFTGTLDNNKDALFETAAEIERFVSALAENDRTVRDFNDSLASASGVLEAEREELAEALRNLGVAMEQVSSFVRENEEALSQNVKGLVRVSDVLVKQRDALEETLDVAPTALSNLYHTYNVRHGTLDTRANIGESFTQIETNSAGVLCSLTTTVDPDEELCDRFVDILGRAAPGADGATAPRFPKGKGVVEIERVDPTLAGLVEVER
jgi:phospholipid/cholesterol/gamma-HCH transport system substrate-binding protein